ncbi:MAG: alpha/beta hydrolase [PVC group bacterium]|nr:alpha/beta hydrolase [PVC group bacterium]
MYNTKFEHIDRNYKDSLVLIPGWATDYRIFELFDLPYNYLIPTAFWPLDFEQELLLVLAERKIEEISLFGYSLGGFLAAELAVRNPDLISKVVLAGIRTHYPKKEIGLVKRLLKKDKVGYLDKFYEQCFLDNQEFLRFKEKLSKNYVQEFSLEYLLKTLDYLEQTSIDVESLNKLKTKVTLIHGEDDHIAPIQGAQTIKNKLNNCGFLLLEDVGHFLFWDKKFNGLNGLL